MGASRRSKWKKGELTAAEKFFDEKPLREKAQQLAAADQLFVLDAEGADDTSHFSRGARRLLQRQQLVVEGSSSSGSSSSSSSKKPLLEVATQAHKKQLERVIKGSKKRAETAARIKAKRTAEECVDLWEDEPLDAIVNIQKNAKQQQQQQQQQEQQPPLQQQKQQQQAAAAANAGAAA
ncbi:hypothetical protein, conserved [Eimeria tenella]|uniref:Ribosome biogenesis protein NOP53 n=1 Tax=Eimeria tenella TaxID=5802 RepID=U6LAK9_EIMTE|nr:hypothetical protein, conserved [Eimeria tenella]CDJ44810.1 hypothetical protein, conserved [Eimeria tenella]|eukprot:XP_013235558.1 hypothetical protein, conserved [Eimeria tenella]